MKFYLFICLLFLGLFSCSEQQSEKLTKLSSPPPDPPAPDFLTTTSLNLLNPENKLTNYLDSIVYYEKECKLFNQINSAFRILVLKKDSGYRITISSLNTANYDFSRSIGYFKFNCFAFIWEGVLIPSLVTYSGNKEIVRFSEPLESTFENDDRFSDWYFVFENDSLILSSHHKCY